MWRETLGGRGGDQPVKIVPHHFEGRQRAAQPFFGIAKQARQFVESVDRNKRDVLADGFGPQAQDGLGHNPKRSFGTDEELLQIVARIVLDEVVERRHHRSVRQHRFQTQHQIAHHSVADDAIAAGIGGNVSADGCRTARAKIERKKQVLAVGRFARRFAIRIRLRPSSSHFRNRFR